MSVLPEPTPTAPAAGQTHLDDQASQLLAAIEEAMRTPTSHRDDSPIPLIGTTPPVAQPGRPPMSQGAVNASTVMLSAGVASLPVGAVAIGVLLASGHADPTVIGMICAAPAALAIPILAIARLIRGAKPEPDVHHHYSGHVDQRTVHTTTRGVWAKTNNQQ